MVRLRGVVVFRIPSAAPALRGPDRARRQDVRRGVRHSGYQGARDARQRLI